jgi:hypothetical protein
VGSAKRAIPHIAGIALSRRGNKNQAYMNLAKSVLKRGARSAIHDFLK